MNELTGGGKSNVELIINLVYAFWRLNLYFVV